MTTYPSSFFTHIHYPLIIKHVPNTMLKKPHSKQIVLLKHPNRITHRLLLCYMRETISKPHLTPTMTVAALTSHDEEVAVPINVENKPMGLVISITIRHYLGRPFHGLTHHIGPTSSMLQETHTSADPLDKPNSISPTFLEPHKLDRNSPILLFMRLPLLNFSPHGSGSPRCHKIRP